MRPFDVPSLYSAPDLHSSRPPVRGSRTVRHAQTRERGCMHAASLGGPSHSPSRCSPAARLVLSRLASRRLSSVEMMPVAHHILSHPITSHRGAHDDAHVSSNYQMPRIRIDPEGPVRRQSVKPLRESLKHMASITSQLHAPVPTLREAWANAGHGSPCGVVSGLITVGRWRAHRRAFE
ncbi:hypothetical protein CSOJ01_09563 [Colletotrichum sojae]|uniref:Uncharacterized protein n=1 Tax=Colletotrichum sojae TaxID=2175907 RepID=A0A8H6J2K4_9PEZI|nr:hypothetical protein CSOJ01_09563 [Colletotrichum sojae]